MIASVLGGVAAVALFLVPGLGLTELLAPLRRPIPYRLAYAYLSGVAWVAGALYALSHLGRVPIAHPAVAVVTALPMLCGLAVAWRRRSARRAPRRHPAATSASTKERWLTAVTVAFAAIVSLGLLAEAVSEPVLDWDGRMTWSVQAKYVRAAGTVDAPVFGEERIFITHPRYPLLLPLAQVAVQEALGAREDEHAFRALYAAFFPALLLLFHGAARKRAGRRGRTAADLTVLIAAAVPFLSFGEGGAGTAYSDLPLACFYGSALLLLLAPPARRSGHRLAVGLAAGLLLAAAVLTKNEGSVLSAVALLVAVGTALFGSRRGKWADLRRRAAVWLPAIALWVAALALLHSWAARIPNRFDEGYSLASFGTLSVTAYTRLPAVLEVIRHQLFLWRSWTLFWWMVPVVLLAGLPGLRRRGSWPLLAAAAAPLAVGWIAYLVHADPIYLATVTWNRFLLQAAVPGLLVVATALASVQKALLSKPPQ